MKKKKNEFDSQVSHPRILEIEEQEIEEKKPPRDDIIYFKIVDMNENSKSEKEKQ